MEELNEHFTIGTPWEHLPAHVKLALGDSRSEYESQLVEFHLERQTPYDANDVTYANNAEMCFPTRSMFSKKEYYSQLILYIKAKLGIYPYQFVDIIINELKITPFSFYFDMLVDIMKSEKSYDVLPNFTAADIVRLLGIGRNQYIDIMNKVRSKKWIWRINKSIVKEYLPNQIQDIHLEHWWIVKYRRISQNESQKLSNTLSTEEYDILTVLQKEDHLHARRIPIHILRSLLRKNLVYLEVPIDDNDFLYIPPLKNFVMNRVTNDYFEKLLYDVFVSLDERTSVKQLASILEIDIQQLKQALSLYCRLGFAKKKISNPLEKSHPSYDQATAELIDASWIHSIDQYHQELSQESLVPLPQDSIASDGTGSTTGDEYKKRVGLLFDSSLTAYLMMGNLTQGLKSHAVTLFEAGKMPDEQLGGFITELDKIDNEEVARTEGEAQRYFVHAITLRNTLKFLRHNPQFDIGDTDGGVDMIRCESIDNLDPETKLRILDKSYSVLVATAPLTPGSLTLSSCVPNFFGPPLPQVSSTWFKLYLYECAECGPATMVFRKGSRVHRVPAIFKDCTYVSIAAWDQEPNIVATTTMLQVLNDTLVHAPTIVQAHAYTATRTQVFEVPFPYNRSVSRINRKNAQEINDDIVTRSQGSSPQLSSIAEEEGLGGNDDDTDNDDLIVFATNNSNNKKDENQEKDSKQENKNDEVNEESKKHDGENENENENEDDQVEEIMLKLTEKLHLEQSFGFVKMMRVVLPPDLSYDSEDDDFDELDDVPPERESVNKEDRVALFPVELFFGIPLADPNMNKAVCDVVVERELFTQNSMSIHSQNMRTLCTEFLHFVDQNLDVPFRMTDQPPLPTSNIIFAGPNTKETPKINKSKEN